MTLAHTPGPWTFHEDGDANHYCLLIDNGKRWLVSFLQNGELWTNEQRANARLIAQAPALSGVLIEALQAWAADFEDVEGRVDPVEFLPWFGEWRLRAREALKAAGVEA